MCNCNIIQEICWWMWDYRKNICHKNHFSEQISTKLSWTRIPIAYRCTIIIELSQALDVPSAYCIDHGLVGCFNIIIKRSSRLWKILHIAFYTFGKTLDWQEICYKNLHVFVYIINDQVNLKGRYLVLKSNNLLLDIYVYPNRNYRYFRNKRINCNTYCWWIVENHRLSQ